MHTYLDALGLPQSKSFEQSRCQHVKQSTAAVPQWNSFE